MKIKPEMIGFREANGRDLPRASGVYIACRNGTPVYVGQSVNLFKRGRWHGFLDGCVAGRQFRSDFSVRYALIPEKFLTMVEKAMIQHYRPEFNKNFNPDWVMSA